MTCVILISIHNYKPCHIPIKDWSPVKKRDQSHKGTCITLERPTTKAFRVANKLLIILASPLRVIPGARLASSLAPSLIDWWKAEATHARYEWFKSGAFFSSRRSVTPLLKCVGAASSMPKKTLMVIGGGGSSFHHVQLHPHNRDQTLSKLQHVTFKYEGLWYTLATPHLTFGHWMGCQIVSFGLQLWITKIIISSVKIGATMQKL